MRLIARILSNNSPKAGFYACSVDHITPPVQVMKSVVRSMEEKAREGYCVLVSHSRGEIVVEALEGWTPTNGDTLVAARMVPMMTAEVEK